MKNLTTCLLISSFMALAANAEVPTSITSLIGSGEFSKAEALINKEKGLSVYQKDSLLSIMSRIRSDFRIPYEEGVRQIQQKFSNASDYNIQQWESKKYIETMTIDGQKYLFRKAVSNLDRLVPELSFERRYEGIVGDQKYAKYAEDVIKTHNPETHLGDIYRAKVKFTIDVKPDAVPKGETVRVWMPFPYENGRQSNIKLESSSHKVTYSKNSLHNSIYMEQKSGGKEPLHFEAVFLYDVQPMYFSADYILTHLKEYDKSSELYKKYTSTELPQVILTDEMKTLAQRIVGNETNPYRQASLIYDWIDTYFPWAGAREYSTIPNMAEYVLENGHGDCGQVSLLYITLVRSLGIPARWESGWMLHPSNVGMHDWAETYYEGIGWVPVDMSFGGLEVSPDSTVRNFYKSGIDMYRLAVNKGVGGEFSPKKNWVRSETVDFQLGEVEWKGGNLFYYKEWEPKLELISFEKK